ASYLAAIAFGTEANPLISRARATELPGTTLGGYNVSPRIALLGDAERGPSAADAREHTRRVLGAFHGIAEQAKTCHAHAKARPQSGADVEWFPSKPEVPQSLTVTVVKAPGETNAHDLSPAPDATTRPDIPMHALAMLKNRRLDAP